MGGRAWTLTATTNDVEAGPHGNVLVLDEMPSYMAPEGMFQLPRIERGEEVFDVVIPDGLQLSLIDLATPDASMLATAEIVNRPARGATGALQLRVRWSYPVPLGSLQFRLRVYASPDGTPPPVITPLIEPGSHNRMRTLIEQDAPVDMTIDGPLANTFKTQILDRGGSLLNIKPDSDGGVSAGTVVVIIAVVAAICIGVGFATFGAVLIIAMQKGYNIDDAGYKVVVGEGSTRQEHNMVFNIRKPDT